MFIIIVAGCATYREQDIDGDGAAEIKGGTGAMIQIEDGEKSLTERGRDYKAYIKAVVAQSMGSDSIDFFHGVSRGWRFNGV
jgi:hypothetical protein